MAEMTELLIAQIKVGEHRKRSEQEDDEIAEIAASIKRVGVLEPLIVVRKDGGFLLVAGHRRIAAAAIAGLSQVPVCITEADESVVKEISFAENFFRRNLSAVEQAAAIRECIDEGSMSIEQLAKGFHRTQQWITNQMTLTTWPPEVLDAIHRDRISVSAAANIAAIPEPRYRNYLLNNAVENGVTARVTAAWLQAYALSRPAEEALSTAPVDAQDRPAPMVPQAPCMFCSKVQRTDALNYMPVCGQCLADFQTAQAANPRPASGG